MAALFPQMDQGSGESVARRKKKRQEKKQKRQRAAEDKRQNRGQKPFPAGQAPKSNLSGNLYNRGSIYILPTVSSKEQLKANHGPQQSPCGLMSIKDVEADDQPGAQQQKKRPKKARAPVLKLDHQQKKSAMQLFVQRKGEYLKAMGRGPPQNRDASFWLRMLDDLGVDAGTRWSSLAQAFRALVHYRQSLAEQNRCTPPSDEMEMLMDKCAAIRMRRDVLCTMAAGVALPRTLSGTDGRMIGEEQYRRLQQELDEDRKRFQGLAQASRIEPRHIMPSDSSGPEDDGEDESDDTSRFQQDEDETALLGSDSDSSIRELSPPTSPLSESSLTVSGSWPLGNRQGWINAAHSDKKNTSPAWIV